MSYEAAIRLGISFRVLAETAADSAAQVCPGTVTGNYRSLADLRAFAAGCTVVTFDHEHVPAPHLEELEREAAGGATRIRPGAAPLRFAQDKLAMRTRLAGLGVGCPRFAPVSSVAEVGAFAGQVGWPVVLKAASGGYDGRGVWLCHTPAEAAAVVALPVRLLAEERVPFERELAALAARSPDGRAAAYPVVETVQAGGVCTEVLAPAPDLPAADAGAAQALALRLADELGVTGLLAVELFSTPAGLLVNELAMRPHNSGHWTIEGAVTSQFEQHLRAVLGLPLGDPRPAAAAVVMANVFGTGDPGVYARYGHVMAADPGAKVHIYGKAARPGRKIGHVTVAGDGVAELRQRAVRAARYLAGGKD